MKAGSEPALTRRHGRELGQKLEQAAARTRIGLRVDLKYSEYNPIKQFGEQPVEAAEEEPDGYRQDDNDDGKPGGFLPAGPH